MNLRFRIGLTALLVTGRRSFGESTLRDKRPKRIQTLFVIEYVMDARKPLPDDDMVWLRGLGYDDLRMNCRPNGLSVKRNLLK